MSRILNRPMFRGGGKVSSYGKGIASGLTSKPKRGLVDEPGGYAGISMSGLSNYNEIFNNAKNTGANVVQAAKDKVSQGTSKTKNLYNKSKNFLKSKNFSEKGLKKGIEKYGKKGLKIGSNLAKGIGSRFPMASYLTKGAAPYYAMYKASEVTPVDKKYDISRSENLFAPFYGEETMNKKIKRNYEQASNPNNFFRYDPSIYGPRKDHPDYDPTKIKYNPFSDDKGAADTPIRYNKDGEIIRYNDGEGLFGKTASVDQQEKTDTPPFVPEVPLPDEPVPLTMKEQVAKDKALFADLLGEGEARGKDVSDMLLRFAGSGGNTVGEKFQQYIGAEAMAGPSRTEKINQAAASLAINDYIAGKRSKENMEMMIARTEKNVDYTIQKQKERDAIKGKDFVEAVGMEATAQKKNVSDTNVIATVIYKQTGKAPKIVSDFANEVYGPNTDIDETKLITGLNIVTFKDRKIVIEKDSAGNLIEKSKEYPI